MVDTVKVGKKWFVKSKGGKIEDHYEFKVDKNSLG